MTLQPATQYEWTVRTLCDTGFNAQSEFAPLVVFTTDPLFPRTGKPELQQDENLGSELNVYPNPSEGNFEMRFRNSSTKKETISISLYDMKGQEIWSEDLLTNSSGELIRAYDLTRFGKGVYFIRIEGSTDSHHQRIVIQ